MMSRSLSVVAVVAVAVAVLALVPAHSANGQKPEVPKADAPLGKDVLQAIEQATEDRYVEVGRTEDNCGRDIVRVPTAYGDVALRKGESKRVDLGFLTNDLLWFCGSDDEYSRNSLPFNAVLLSRVAVGRQMNVVFYRKDRVVDMKRFVDLRPKADK
jgi:hypothetical protein